MKSAKFLALPANSKMAAPLILTIGILLGIIFSWVILANWDRLQAQTIRVVQIGAVRR